MTATLSRPATTVDVTPLRPIHVLELARLTLDHPELTGGSDLATYVRTRRWAMHLVARRTTTPEPSWSPTSVVRWELPSWTRSAAGPPRRASSRSACPVGTGWLPVVGRTTSCSSVPSHPVAETRDAPAPGG